jgi:hypothetical protein
MGSVNEIICVGTSLTQGGGMHPKRDKKIVEWYKSEKDMVISDVTHSYPAIIGKLTGKKVRNLGKCGAGLYYLMRTVEDILEDENTDDKLFILEYSNTDRIELWSNRYKNYLVVNYGPRDGVNPENGHECYMTFDYNLEYEDTDEVWWNFNPDEVDEPRLFDKYLDYFHDNHLWMIQQDRFFLNFLYKLKSKGIKFILHGQSPYWEGFYNEPIINEKFYKFMYHTDKKNKKDDFCTWLHCINKQMSITKETNELFIDDHPNPKGHEYIAETLLSFIKEHGLL